VDVDAVAVTGTWWRQTPYGGDPLYRADPPSDGRWQRGDVVGAMYFADSEQTAWAEWYRALAEFAIPPDRQMPRDLWRWDVRTDHVADLSTLDRLAAVGLPAPRPGRAGWMSFQVVGQQLWQAGYAGVQSPSAARPEALVLALFWLAQEVPSASPVRPALTYRRPPTPPTGMTT